MSCLTTCMWVLNDSNKNKGERKKQTNKILFKKKIDKRVHLKETTNDKPKQIILNYYTR